MDMARIMGWKQILMIFIVACLALGAIWVKKIRARSQLRNTAQMHWNEDKKRLHNQFLDVIESARTGNIIHMEIDSRTIMFSISYLKDDSRNLRGTPGSRKRDEFLEDLRDCGGKLLAFQKQASWELSGSPHSQNLTLPPEIANCVNLAADPSI